MKLGGLLMEWFSTECQMLWRIAWFYFTLLSVGQNLGQLFNQSDSKTNHDLVTRLLQRWKNFACIYFEFSLAFLC